MLTELKELPDEEFDMLVAEMLGYGVYAIDGGKLVPTAKFALADTMDGEQGFYVEAETIATVLICLDDLLESQNIPAITNYPEVE